EERAAALFVGSWIASERGERDRERVMLDEVLPDAERLGGLLLARVLGGLSVCAIGRGDVHAASTYAERVRELAEQLQHPLAARESLALLGAVAIMRDDIQESLRYAAEALALAVGTGDLEGQALAHSNLGVGRHLLGDAGGSQDEYDAALHHYGAARTLEQRLGRRLQSGMSAANMAQVQIRRGEDPEAQQLLLEALTVVRQSGGTATLLFCVMVEADRQLVNGDPTTALELIGVVQRHPAVTNTNEAEIARILHRSGLPADVIEQGLARGARRDFDAVVDQLARELA
ncbi:MAG TPA: hypothetical protein VIT64_08075, partial [Ilumatobacteraceae bacterium]